ncbi:unnamed protein product [Brassica oleracea]
MILTKHKVTVRFLHGPQIFAQIFPSYRPPGPKYCKDHKI